MLAFFGILSLTCVGLIVSEVWGDDDDPAAAPDDGADGVKEDLLDRLGVGEDDPTGGDEPETDEEDDPDGDPDSGTDPETDPETDPGSEPETDPDDPMAGYNVIVAEGPESVSGTDAPDWMTAPGATPMSGLGGDDVMISQGSAPADGGTGDDLMVSEAGGALFGGDGNDTIEALDGGEHAGGDGDDEMSGADATLRGGLGDDVLEGTNSRLTGDAGNDTLTGSEGSSVAGGAGNDEIFVDSGSEGAGGAGDDRVIGRADTVRMPGEPAPERTYVEGNTGSDFVQGNTGVDIVGGQDDSVLQAVIGQEDYYGVTNSPDGSTPAELGPARMIGYGGADQFEVRIDDLGDRSDDLWADDTLDIVSVFADDPHVIINDYTPGEDTLLVDSEEEPEGLDITSDGDGGTLVVLDYGTALNNRGESEDITVTIQLRGVDPDGVDEGDIVLGSSTA